ncbi:MAG TPA: arylsulfatase, partial [Isosphaeraceae bacterium]|nr:arylsulfatase [Isosphaeraceae bacterium]
KSPSEEPRLMPRLIGLILALCACVSFASAAEKPNIVLIYADDLGFGDISFNGAKPGLTPNIDRLAKQGLNFTDAHCTSATCTPSRYGLLTGQYPWRKQGTGILPGDAKLIIDTDQTTLPGILQKAGYHTGVVGKWHLGLGDGSIDWNGQIKPGPLEVGFDESFIMAATGDRVPCVFVKGHHIVGLDPNDPIEVSYSKNFEGEPTGKANPELLKMHPSHGHDMSIVNGISRIGYMKGGKSALWTDEDMADTFTQKAVSFIKNNVSKPFFLYFATHDIHVPRVPHPRFVGKSGMGPRGDAIVEFDWSVGEVLKALDEANLTDNTLFLLSSDNGPVIDDGYQDQAVQKLGSHKAAGPYRGGKYSKFEGGTRVPLIVRWPGHVEPGTTSQALVNQVDFLASFAALVGQSDRVPTSLDSRDHLASLLGKNPVGREALVEQGNGLAVRRGKWKFIPASKGSKMNKSTNTELGNDRVPQLYDLETDPGETRNVAKEHAEIVEQLRKELDGR